MVRRKYSVDYKREVRRTPDSCGAVGLPLAPGATLSQVAADLGINANLLGRWRQVLAAEGARAFPGHGQARDTELMQLKRELARVKKERNFLREAAAFFAKGSQ